MTVSDIGGLGVWGVVGGVLLFVVLNANIAKHSNVRVISWCLGVGGLSVAFFVVHWLVGFSSMSPKALLAFGFVGMPVLVAGLGLVVVRLFKARNQDADIGS